MTQPEAIDKSALKGPLQVVPGPDVGGISVGHCALETEVAKHKHSPASINDARAFEKKRLAFVIILRE